MAGTAGDKRIRQASDGVPATRTSGDAAAGESRSLVEDDCCPEPNEPVAKTEVGVLSNVDPKGKAESKVEASAEEPAPAAKAASSWGLDASADTKVEIACPLPKSKIARDWPNLKRNKEGELSSCAGAASHGERHRIMQRWILVADFSFRVWLPITLRRSFYWNRCTQDLQHTQESLSFPFSSHPC